MMATAAPRYPCPTPPTPRSRPISLANERKSLLRFITCGSVDDGKSTLIGRLLYDSKMLFEDQLAALESDSRKAARTAAARFRLARRRPRRRARAGHHHRRRLPLLRDRHAQVHRRRHARPRAIYPQHGDRRLDRRSRGDPDRCAQGRARPRPGGTAIIAHLLGIRNIVLAVNKMDLVGYDQARFEAIVADYRAFARQSASTTSPPSRCRRWRATTSPRAAPKMAWYEGPALLEHLEHDPGRARPRAASRSACRCNG